MFDEDSFEKFTNDLLNILYPIKKSPKVIGVTGTNGKDFGLLFWITVSNSTGHICVICWHNWCFFGREGKLPTEHPNDHSGTC